MRIFDRKFDQAERDQRRYDAAPDHEKINYHIKDGNKAVISELRFIRWILIFLTAIAMRAMFEFAGSDWWYTSGW